MAKGMVSGVRMSTFKHWFYLVPVKVAQSCPTLCNPIDYTVHEILQDTVLEWEAFPFSRGSSKPRPPALQVDSLPAEPHDEGCLVNK